MPKLRRINVVFIYVADMERSRRFYEDVVGFGQPILKTESWVEYRLEGGAHFALHRTTPEALEGGRPVGSNIRFSIVVDDLAEACAQLEGKGVELVRPPEKGYGFDLAEFEDPEGNPIRFLQFTTMKPVE